jgi:photosystem II stability/assembly factor-like uncharacterized protein
VCRPFFFIIIISSELYTNTIRSPHRSSFHCHIYLFREAFFRGNNGVIGQVLPPLALSTFLSIFIIIMQSTLRLAACLSLGALHGAAAGSNWEVVDSPTFESNSVLLQVAFTDDGKVGYAGAGTPSCPASVIKSTDSGKTWDTLWPQNCSAIDFNLLLSTAVRDPTHAIVGGAFYQTWTKDGKHVYPALNNFGTPPQDAGVIPGSGQFALVSGKESRVGGNTVDVSDNGEKYTRIQIPDTVMNSTDFLARYGTFPSKDVWYITAGTFANSATPLQKSKHFTIDEKTATVSFDVDESNSSPFSAGIVKTTDGGTTWELVYKNDNTGDNIYPNGIDCISETNCVAVLEGESARIIVTRDGGKTWKETMHDDDPKSSLMAVSMISEKEVWAAGGHPAFPKFEGRFWHSLDGGETWKKEAFPGTYIVSLDMNGAKGGYAVALTDTSPAGLKLFKYAPSSD